MRDDAAQTIAHDSSSNGFKEEIPATIQEYDDLFQAIQVQLSQCKSEQDALRSKLEQVILENNSLSEQLNVISKNNFVYENGDVIGLNKNAQEQLEIAIQEKDSALEMWQTALQLISALENELKDYRDNSHLTSALDKANEVREEYSTAICLLEDKLSAVTSRLGKEKALREHSVEKLQQLQNDFKVLNDRYGKRSEEVDKALIGQQAALKKLADLEKSHAKALEEAKEASLSCSELEEALERSVARLEGALSQKDEAQEKVAEALQIVDAAMIERTNALSQASKSKDEVSKLRVTIAELITEAGAQVQTEAEQIKQHYNNRIKTVLHDMRRLHEENRNKSSQLQKMRADLNLMEEELQKTKRELENALRDRPSLLALDRKLEGLFRTKELAGGDAIRVELEHEQLRAEIVKQNQRHELEQRQFILDRHILEEQIKALQVELENAALTVSDVSARAEVLSVSLRQRDHEVAVLKKALASSLCPEQSSDKRCECGARSQLSEQLRILEEGNKMNYELTSQLNSQRKLSQKWKSEVNDIALRFRSRLKEVHSEVTTLRKENRDLRNHLQSAWLEAHNHSVIMNDYSSRMKHSFSEHSWGSSHELADSTS